MDGTELWNTKERKIEHVLQAAAGNLSIGLSTLLRNSLINRTTLLSTPQNVTYDTENETFVSAHEICGNSTEAAEESCRFYQSSTKSVHLSHSITMFISTVIITVGLVCNILGMVIFRSQKLRQSSTAVYLFYLAFSDNVYLLVVFLTRILETMKCLYFQESKIDIYNRSSFGCTGLQYILDVASDCSTCILLVVAIERYLACYHAFIYRTRCTSRTAKWVTLCLVVALSIFNIPHHILFVKHKPENNICDISEGNEVTFIYMYMAEAVLFRIIPTYSIAILNIFIIYKLWKRPRANPYSSVHSNISLSSTRSNGGNVYRPPVGQENNYSTNLILITMSSFYIVCYQPILVCYVLSSLNWAGLVCVGKDTIIMFRNYSRCLYILGYAMNFFFYTVAGEVFRKELKRILHLTACKN